MKVFKILISLSIIISSCGSNREYTELYPGGQVKLKVPLLENERHGKYMEFYEDGSIKRTSIYKRGKLHGETVFYYRTGEVEQLQEFRDGVRCCVSKFYLPDGSLREVQFYNEAGNLLDYTKYNKDGTQDMNIQTRVAIFITDQDSIKTGETFKAKIRLGNMEYNSIEVVLGDPTNKFILRDNPKLPKIDSKTALLEIDDYNLGLNQISGVVVERDSSAEKRKEMIIF